MSWFNGDGAGLFSLSLASNSNLSCAGVGMRECLGISMDYVTGSGECRKGREKKDMSMISNQVKELRDLVYWNSDNESVCKALLDAADTIEALSEKLSKVNLE